MEYMNISISLSDYYKSQGLKLCRSGVGCLTFGNIDGWNPANSTYYTIQKSASDGFHPLCKKCKQSKEVVTNPDTPIMTTLRRKSNAANLKNKNGHIATFEVVTLMITQNYKDVASNNDLIDNIYEISLDHVIPTHKDGLNVISNTLLVRDIFNFGKNGYDFDYALEYFFDVGGVTEENRIIRRKEIKTEIQRVRYEFPSVLEKVRKRIKGVQRKYELLELTLKSKIDIKDLFNT